MSKSEVKHMITQNLTNDSLDFEALISRTNEFTEEKLPDHIIFPKELNLFLRNRIQYLPSALIWKKIDFVQYKRIIK
ncbi:uncharacterized protein LOC143152020 isoform X2 [Ptiloglossa arizonensis]|uniref:uncharacterized protein LOC143152020 isoform X2 n=1 Tax=Ptiloglossa arizonensis TaxID=3350558 RepID=UPI003FA008F6